MCGRYTLRTPSNILIRQFAIADVPPLSPRYNIAPTQDVLAVKWSEHGRAFDLLRWGLIPPWAEDPSIGNRMINARAETVRTKPAFRHAFKNNRCLIVADGFFEWQKVGAAKQPMLIGRADGSPFAFAGLWESWKEIKSCTIITTAANDFMRPVHDRMPVIVPAANYDRWLSGDDDAAEKLLLPNADGLTMVPVSKSVNNPRNDGPGCVEPVETANPSE